MSLRSIISRIRFPWNRYQKYLCRKQGVRFSDQDSVRFFGESRLAISPDSQVSIGKNFACRSGVKYSFDNGLMSKILTWGGSELTIGDNVGISNTLIYCSQKITIGNNVFIGGGTMIFDNNFHSVDYLDRRGPDNGCGKARRLPVTIDDDVFIGAKCIILKGVTIGARSTIAAGSVVVKDIPSDCIAGGNPCKVIKMINNPSL